MTVKEILESQLKEYEKERDALSDDLEFWNTSRMSNFTLKLIRDRIFDLTVKIQSVHEITKRLNP